MFEWVVNKNVCMYSFNKHLRIINYVCLLDYDADFLALVSWGRENKRKHLWYFAWRHNYLWLYLIKFQYGFWGTNYISKNYLFIFSDMWEFLGKSGCLLSQLDLSLTFDTVDSDVLLDLPETWVGILRQH